MTEDRIRPTIENVNGIEHIRLDTGATALAERWRNSPEGTAAEKYRAQHGEYPTWERINREIYPHPD